MTTLTSTISGNPESKKMINHIIFLIDASGSMGHRLNLVKQVFDSTLQQFKQNQTPDQEIRISLYDFDSRVNRLIYNTNLNDLNYQVKFEARGTTALRDAIDRGIDDHTIINTKNEDHSFLIYCITDGADNASRISVSTLKSKIASLNDSWTVAALVPSLTDSHAAKMSGIPAGNIQIWDANSNKGFEEVGKAIASSYTNYSVQRSKGVRSSSNIFQVNADNIKRADIRAALSEVKGRLYHAQNDYVIKDMVEKFTNSNYVKGSTYYELSKSELVQSYKEIIIVSRKDDKKFGGQDARDMLGLPDSDTKVKPGDFGDWRIFIQSTSVNRKIKAGTSIFVKE